MRGLATRRSDHGGRWLFALSLTLGALSVRSAATAQLATTDAALAQEVSADAGAAPSVQAAGSSDASERAPATSAQVPPLSPPTLETPNFDVPSAPASAGAMRAGEQAELDAIMADQGVAAELEMDGPSLRVYGFADSSFVKSYYLRAESKKARERPSAFLVGNVNLYAAADLTNGFSSLLEVRFTYMPNGTVNPSTLEFTSTSATDNSDLLRTQNWGGIILERVHLDYSYRSWLNLRVGSFLTPYGIWNVDHGSPTIIPVNKPYAIGEQLFPERQVGVAAFGSLLLRNTTLGYHLTASNGRGDIQQLDFDENKALGARLFVSTEAVGHLTVGVSAYGGRGTRRPTLRLVSGNPITFAYGSDDQFKELALAADLLWEWRGVRVQGELISRQTKYLDPGRFEQVTGTAVPSLTPDNLAWSSYLLLAYRLPWYTIMPYVQYSNFERGYGGDAVLVGSGNLVNAMTMSGGVNIRPVPAVALKAQFSYAWHPSGEDDNLGSTISIQAAWAF
jgi:hypothetical protein